MVKIIGPFFGIWIIPGLFHDFLPPCIGRLEYLGFLNQILGRVRGVQNRLKVKPVPLMENPLIQKFLQIPKHFLLVFHPIPYAIDVLTRQNTIDLKQSIVNPANQIVVIA